MTAGAAFQPRIPTAPSRNLRRPVIDAAGFGGFRHAVELACKLRQRGLDIDVAGFVRELQTDRGALPIFSCGIHAGPFLEPQASAGEAEARRPIHKLDSVGGFLRGDGASPTALNPPTRATDGDYARSSQLYYFVHVSSTCAETGRRPPSPPAAAIGRRRLRDAAVLLPQYGREPCTHLNHTTGCWHRCRRPI